MKSPHISFREKFNLWDFYLHRYIRLSPAKIVAMVFSIFIFNVKYGPVYDLSNWLAREEDTCRTWWWAGLLYSQNYINPQNPVSQVLFPLFTPLTLLF